jgi:signal transduction histidine kinase/PAS domain-containing protein
MAETDIFHVNIYALPLVVSATLSYGLGLVVWLKRRDQLTNKAFIVLMVALGSWALCMAVDLSLTTLEAKLWTVLPVYIFVFTAVAAWLIFALAYAGYEQWLTRRAIALLTLEPSLFLLLYWTNSSHHLLWTRVWFAENLPYASLIFDFGPAFWLHTLYSYTLLLWGTVLILQPVYHSFRFYRRQAGLILAAVLVPWMGNLLYLLGLVPLDLAPVGFSFTGLVLAWGLLNLRLLDITPLARTAVFDNLTDAILIVDKQNRLVDFNPSARALLPLPDQAAIGQPIMVLFPDLGELLNQPVPLQTESQLESGGQTLSYDLHFTAIYDRQYQEVGRSFVLRDTTRRNMTQRSEQQQRALAEALRDVATTLNESLDLDEVLQKILTEVSRVVPHDTANVMLLQEGKARLIGYRGLMGQTPPDAPQVWLVDKTPNLKQMVVTGQPSLIPDTFKDPNWVHYPTTSWIRSYLGTPIVHKEEILGFINLNSASANAFQPEDVQQLQAFANQAAIALWNARLFAELEERNRELDAYAHTIAHDLRAPLNLLRGYAELVSEYELPAMGRAQLDVMQVTIERMEEMIDQLLFLAQLRDARGTAVPLDTTPFIYSAIARFNPIIEARGLLIRVKPDLHPVLGHATWLEEIFSNLLSNAIKYIGSNNPEPVIQIRSRPIDDNMIRYEVEDNGLGIDPAYQSRVFELFARFHQEEAPGTGLGLAIVQRIVQKLGGQLGVESGERQGSTFWFTLPALPPANDDF